jgi:hypothetical protein
MTVDTPASKPMHRTQRIGLGVGAAGLALAVLSVVLLQVDPSGLATAHSFLHGSGMVFMLAGLLLYLATSVAQRHRERLRRAIDRAAAAPLPSASATKAAQYLGGAFMATGITGEIVIRLEGAFFVEGLLLVSVGGPGAVLWLFGVGTALATASARRLGLLGAPGPRTGSSHRAVPIYPEWDGSETAGDPVESQP